MFSNWGLVIQGPIASRGKNGSGEIVDFDSTENLVSLVVLGVDLFDEVVLSTWEGANPRLIDRLVALGCKVIESQEGHAQIQGRDNRYKQFYSSLIGLESLSPNIGMAIKIRTDQFFDIQSFCSELLECNSSYKDYGTVGQKGYLQFLSFRLDKPFGLSDFAVAGEKQQLIDFYRCQFLPVQQLPRTFKSQDWPEGTAVRNYIFSILRGKLELDDYYFQPVVPKRTFTTSRRRFRPTYNSDHFYLWWVSMRCLFSVSSREVLDTLSWRGSQVVFDSSLVGTRESWLELRISPSLKRGGLGSFGMRMKPNVFWATISRKPRVAQLAIRSSLLVRQFHEMLFK